VFSLINMVNDNAASSSNFSSSSDDGVASPLPAAALVSACTSYAFHENPVSLLLLNYRQMYPVSVFCVLRSCISYARTFQNVKL
jgi:hypothetical protein